jgi:hypothetical protein
MAYTTTYPVSPNGGLIFGEPTTYLSSGTYVVPPTATINSTIMVESIGGGAGGGGSNTTGYWVGASNLQARQSASGSLNFSEYCGRPGSYFIGVFRLGFISTSPAGISLTVNIGAGGTGCLKTAQTVTSPANNSGGDYARTAATSGASSNVSFGSITFAVGAGGTATTSYAGTAYTTSGTFADSSLLSSIMARPGTSKFNFNWTGLSTNTFSGITMSGGQDGRDDNATLYTAQDIVSSGVAPVTLSPGTIGTQGADGGPFQGGQNGHPFAKIGTTGTYTFARAGNGGQPGGSGGAPHGCNETTPNGSVSYTFSQHQMGGNGGAGRVRIWYQA